MRLQILKEYVTELFGFPIQFDEVFAVEMQGELVPLIDFGALEPKIFMVLANRPSRLTGAEIKFIRKHLDLTLTAFGAQFGVAHSAVKKWEDDTSVMNWGSEVLLRLIALKASGQASIDTLFEQLSIPRSAPSSPIILSNAEVNHSVTRLLDPVRDRDLILEIERRLHVEWGSGESLTNRITENASIAGAPSATTECYRQLEQDGIEDDFAVAA
jgi:transcriptional regulator with XRE-family HTH domain